MLMYNDERWNDVIEGRTRREWRAALSGLMFHGQSIHIDEDDANLRNLINQTEKLRQVRREHGNAPPINLHPISEKEFAQSGFFLYHPIFTEYRQIHPWDKELNQPSWYMPNRTMVWPWEENEYDGYIPPKSPHHRDGQMIQIRLFYMSDGTGYGVSHDFWGGRINYFKFGCNHQWGAAPEEHPSREERLFRCQSLYYCVKCGHWEIIDSSD